MDQLVAIARKRSRQQKRGRYDLYKRIRLALLIKIMDYNITTSSAAVFPGAAQLLSSSWIFCYWANAYGSTTYGQYLLILQQGTQYYNYLQSRIRLTRIRFKFVLQYSATSLSSTDGNVCDIVRICIVKDKQPNGALPSSTSLVWSQNSITSYRNWLYNDRFEILWDECINMPIVSTYSPSSSNPPLSTIQTIMLNRNIPLNVPVDLLSSTQAVADIASNNILVMALSYAGNSMISKYSTVRLYWTDQ